MITLLLVAWHTFAAPALPATPDKDTISFKFTPAAEKKKSSLNILLIHGLVSSKQTWSPVEQSLASFGNVWSIDLPGYGDSFKIKSKDWREVETALMRFIKEKKLHQALVVGHSMGARVAVLLAPLLMPKGLIIEDMDMEPRSVPKSDDHLAIFKEGAQSKDQLRFALKKENYFAQTIARIEKDQLIFENGKYFAKINPLIDHDYQSNVMALKPIKDSWRALPPGLSILLLRSSKNSSISENGLSFMKKTHKNLSYEQIAHSNHSIHNSNPDRFVKAFARFVENLKPE